MTSKQCTKKAVCLPNHGHTLLSAQHDLRFNRAGGAEEITANANSNIRRCTKQLEAHGSVANPKISISFLASLKNSEGSPTP